MELTVIILVKDIDNDSKLKKTVESVSFVDEVLVVKEKFPIHDFSEVRNLALDRAEGEWVLFVDSDEMVTQQLSKEIEQVVKFSFFNFQFSKQGYFLRRQDKFLGKWLKYGETAGVRLLRLAKKDAGRWVRPVHEVWKVEGNIGELKNPLLHYSHDSIEGMAEKLDRYSEIEAEWRLKQMDKWSEWLKWLRWLRWLECVQLILFPVGKFIQNYIFRLGFLDGTEGFIHAGMMSFHSFLVRAKKLARSEFTNTSE